MSPRRIYEPIVAFCSWCRAEKPHYKSKGDKIVRICVDCRASMSAAPAFREKRRATYRNNLSRMLLDHAKGSARRRGLVFDLAVDDITIPETCPVFGTPLEVGSGKRSDNSPSLDRIIPHLGYVA